MTDKYKNNKGKCFDKDLKKSEMHKPKEYNETLLDYCNPGTGDKCYDEVNTKENAHTNSSAVLQVWLVDNKIKWLK